MTRRSALVLLAVFGIGVFLSGLELMITAVALPSILEDLADPSRGTAWVELRKASWIINGYLLVFILTMPLAGRMTDLWGARRPFMAGLAIFVVGSALAGMSQTMDQLIAARLVQAAGGGVLVPVATAAAAHLFDGAARPRALGVVGALTFLGMAAGPFVGATILGSVNAEEVFGPALEPFLAPAWRWVFYINIPIGLIALAPRLGGVGRLGHAATSRAPRRPRRGLVRAGAAPRAGRADARGHGFHRGQRGRARLGHSVPARRGRGDDRRSGSCAGSASPTRSSIRDCSPIGRSPRRRWCRC